MLPFRLMAILILLCRHGSIKKTSVAKFKCIPVNAMIRSGKYTYNSAVQIVKAYFPQRRLRGFVAIWYGSFGLYSEHLVRRH